MKDQLIQAVINIKDSISYINLNENNQYRGWTYDFNIILPDDRKMYLDLKQEDDLFLLFVLASSWSKTGPWENAAFFTTYLKASRKFELDLWYDEKFVKNEIANKDVNAAEIVKNCSGLVSRKKVSFRRDLYASVSVLARNWNTIKTSRIETREHMETEVLWNSDGQMIYLKRFCKGRFYATMLNRLSDAQRRIL